MKLGVCYYPEQWPESLWEQDAAEMVAAGIEWVRIGEFAWSRYEPNPGEYQWDWLKRSLDILGNAGLKVVLGTPTATPPKWLMDLHPDIIAIDEEGKPRGFGSRRHYCFSSEVYKKHCSRIVTEMAKQFGHHPAVTAWQTDNEYGCHDTILSYSEAARDAFRIWCSNHFNDDIQALNTAWGNVFWSMEYRSFDEIDLPNLTVTESNPAHRLDFWRFSSDQVAVYNKLQADILRELSPKRDLIHNYMGNFTDFDHHDCSAELDIASWDSYPLGFLDQSRASDAEKAQWMRTGHPDFAAFHHDLYRGTGKGRMWVMEQQPGPVNWAPHNPSPLNGMVRFWTWEAFAHGAEVVSYFRWRQAPFAQEQMHSGLKRPDNSADLGLLEATQTASDVTELIKRLGQTAPAETETETETETEHTHTAAGSLHKEVALIFDYVSDWSLRVQPQGENYQPLDWAQAIYTACRQAGVNIDILPPSANLEGYAAIVVANQQLEHAALLESLKKTTAQVILGPRSFSKTLQYQVPEQLAPGSLQALIPLRAVRVESLGDFWSQTIEPQHPANQAAEATALKVVRWREFIESSLKPQYQANDGWGFLYQHNNIHYINGCVDQRSLNELLMQLFSQNESLQLTPCLGGLRQQKVGDCQFFFNYGPEEQSIPNHRHTILGGHDLAQGQLAIVRNET